MDIIAGIKNALERGYSISQAKSTLINSGYNLPDVEEAANYLTGNVSKNSADLQIPQPQSLLNLNSRNMPINSANNLPLKPLQTYQSAQKKKVPWVTITLISILIILFISLLMVIIFSNQVVSFIKSILGI